MAQRHAGESNYLEANSEASVAYNITLKHTYIFSHTHMHAWHATEA